MTSERLAIDRKPVECKIRQFRFPAHAKREGLIEVVKKMKPANVILVHGDMDAIDRLGSEILKQHKGVRVYRAEIGNELEID